MLLIVFSRKNFGRHEFAFILQLSLLLADLGLFSDVYDRCCTRYPLFAYKLQGLPVSFDSLTCEGKFRSAPAFGFCPTVQQWQAFILLLLLAITLGAKIWKKECAKLNILFSFSCYLYVKLLIMNIKYSSHCKRQKKTTNPQEGGRARE